MSEINEPIAENVTEPGNGETETGTTSTSILNQVVEAVIALINALSLFATIRRGAMGTGNCLTCEIGPSTPFTVWLDKNQYIPVDITINGKHDNLQTLSDAMNTIHESLTMMLDYPTGDKWQITDIATMTEPQIIGRESNDWMMASALTVNVATFTPDPEPPAEQTGE